MNANIMNKKQYVNLFCISIVIFLMGGLVYINLSFQNGKLIFADEGDYFKELQNGDFSYDYGYHINGDEFLAEIDSPWVGLIDESGMQVTSAKINFKEPLLKNTAIQVYFSTEELREDLSRSKIAKKGTREIVINFPRNIYREIRFDIRGNFILSSIQLSNNVMNSPENILMCINVIGGLLLVVFLLCLGMKNRKILVGMRNIFRNQIMCLSILTFIWGVAFSILIIPWQTPDEYSHLSMIGQGIKNGNLAKNLLNEMPLDYETIRFHSEEKIDHEQIKEVVKKSPSYSVLECMPRGINKEIIRHFPATIGVVVGVLLRVPAYWVIILGKIFSLLFYIGINIITLKLVPQKRELFEVVMLLPMCIQQAASLSYDAVLLPMSFLFIAYILHLKYAAVKVGMREAGLLIGILLCIGLAKIPYVLLGGLVLLVPVHKVQFSVGKWEITGEVIRKWKWLICISIIAFMAGGIYCLRENSWIRLVYASACHFPQTLYLFRITLENDAEHLIVSLIGNFGYLDTPTALWFVSVVTAFVFIISVTYIRQVGKDSYTGTVLRNKMWSVKDRIILYLVWLLCAYVVTLSMVSHTFKMLVYGTESVNFWIDWNEALYQIPYIGGVQGRYYIPILLLILLPMPKLLEMESKIYKVSFFLFYIIAAIYTCSVICVRFW